MDGQLHSPKDVNDQQRRSCWPFVTRKDLDNMEKRIISTITDWAAKEQADITGISATLDGIVTGVKALNDKIAALQNSPGTLSAYDQAALDAIQVASKDLVAKAAGISTTSP